MRPPTVAVVSQPSTDFYAIEDLLEPEEIDIRDRVRTFCEQEVTPRVNEWNGYRSVEIEVADLAPGCQPALG